MSANLMEALQALKALHEATVHPLLYQPKCRDQKQRKRALAAYLAACEQTTAVLAKAAV